MRRFLVVLILTFGFAVVAVPAAGASATTTVSPPPNLPADCSKNVAYGMQHWLASLPPNSTVVAPPGACYLINTGITIAGAQGLTIAGGIWEDETAPVPGASPTGMQAALWFKGGSNITLENLTVSGSSPGGYVPAGAFGGGIRSDGVIGFRVSNVNVNNVWGDGLELAPLRAANDLSGVIINPSENVSVYGLTVNGAGRQGVTLASVNGATLSAVRLKHIGIDFFDVEADQGNEGATNVLINGCETGGVGNLFFANGGASAGGAYTGNITVENCVMDDATAGEAILVQPPTMQPHPRGPFTFVNDSILCGSSTSVSCVESTDANITVANSHVIMPAGTIHEPVYTAVSSSGLTFAGDAVSGYGTPGAKDATSTVNITGGLWAPYAAPKPPAPGPVHAGTGTTTSGGTSIGGSTSTTSSSTTTSTTKPATSGLLGGGTKSGKGNGNGQGGPGTATVLTSDHNDPFSSPLARAVIVLDLGAGAIAYGLILVRRRRHPGVAAATLSVQELLGRPRRGA